MLQSCRRFAMLVAASVVAGILAGCAAEKRPLSMTEVNDLRVSSIRVDVSPIVREGWGATADLVRARLNQDLRLAFADRLDPRASASITVQIKALTLSTFVDGDDAISGSGSSDYLESETFVMVGGVEKARLPVLSTLPASGPWYQADIDQRRLTALVRHHAQWLKITLFRR
jgi:hypothetical protein